MTQPSDDLTRRQFLSTASAGALALNADPAALLSVAGAEVAPPVGLPTAIGAYGPWAATLPPDPPAFSLRREAWTDVDAWRTAARERASLRMARPNAGGTPQPTVHRRATVDGVEIEEISWQLPYGPRTEATVLRPAGVRGRLPAVLGLHDHSGMKFFGREKIALTDRTPHPMISALHERTYGGRAWANELAKQGYVVLVPDAFAFGSRRVRPEHTPERVQNGVVDPVGGDPAQIEAYDRWASAHEAVMAKSLFCGGTTWPGVFLVEDQRALDVLAARPDVDPERLGCCGLSGGGLRSAYLAGMDPRIRCGVCVGMMTTWNDFLAHRSYTHTWMIYVPLLPNELEFPEIMGLRAPLPTLVLNNTEDPLFTLPEMRRAGEILGDVYRRAGAPEALRVSFHPGHHKFDLPMQEEAFAWMERWL